MRQSIQSMFSAMNKMETADSEITHRLLAITENLFFSDPKTQIEERPELSLNDFSSAIPKCKGTQITPVNISLLIEIFRFTAKCPYQFDNDLEKAIRIALEVILPSNWPGASGDVAARAFTVIGFQNNEKTRSLIIQDVCKSICECLNNSKNHKENLTILR